MSFDPKINTTDEYALVRLLTTPSRVVEAYKNRIRVSKIVPKFFVFPEQWISNEKCQDKIYLCTAHFFNNSYITSQLAVSKFNIEHPLLKDGGSMADIIEMCDEQKSLLKISGIFSVLFGHKLSLSSSTNTCDYMFGKNRMNFVSSEKITYDELSACGDELYKIYCQKND